MRLTWRGKILLYGTVFIVALTQFDWVWVHQ